MTDQVFAPRPVLLCILDGWGLRAETADNAVALANTPNYDALVAGAPMASLITHGEDVGLPTGQMGNSEVGHMNLGAGRVVWMDLPRIDKAIREDALKNAPALRAHIAAVKAGSGRTHLLGLVSPGGVHAHQAHMAALAHILAAEGIEVLVHAFLDGRDTPPKSAPGFLCDFADALGAAGRIATVCGRYYAMDRDNRWERVKRAYDVIMTGAGGAAADAQAAIAAAHARGETDEFAAPAALGGYSGAQPGDGLLMANFRSDRAREIMAALAAPDFDGFARPAHPWSDVCGIVEYSTRHNAYMSAIFPQQELKDTLGQVVAAAGKTQFRIAETEKYPHVTFFFNGGVEEANPGETRHMAPSPKVATYDLQPEMSAPAVTAALVAAIESGGYDLIICNFANPDMVGHTGDLAAAMKAVETVDAGLGRALAALREAGGAAIVTADHGNCEMMRDPETGEPHTAHTTNPVPVFLVGGPAGAGLRAGGRLADVAPTLLALMGTPQPAAMTGESLLTMAGA